MYKIVHVWKLSIYVDTDRYTGDPKKMLKAQKSRKNLRTAQTKGKFLILFQESSKSKSECRS